MRSVEIDELLDPLRRTIRNASNHHAAIAVTDQDHLTTILKGKHAHDIGYVHFEIDIGAQQMPPLAETGQRRGVDFVAGLTQKARHFPVTPPAVMAAMHEYVSSHRLSSVTLG